MSVPDQPRRRVNFFAGRILSADDLRAEQEHARARQWLHNRMLHGAGVVSGLDVVVEGGDDIVVSPGMAIDGLGREIVLAEPRRLDGSDVVADSHGRIQVVVAWAEHPLGEVVGPDGPVPDGYVERPDVVLADRTVVEAANDTVVLARAHRRDGELLVDPSVRQRVGRRPSRDA